VVKKMEKNALLITNSGINSHTGGGIVSLNLLQALQNTATVKMILSNQHLKDERYKDIKTYCIEPAQYGYQDPFFMDYMASYLIDELKNTTIDIVQTYACPFGKTIEKMKQNFFCKVIADIAPHQIEISREEHMKMIGSYDYPHLTNEFLWGLYSRHLRLADTVIVHSHSSAEYLQKKANLKELPKVIPHGCYPPERIPPYPDMFVPAYFGALGIDKGLYYMVMAWLQCELPDEYTFFIGGQGTEMFTLREQKNMDRFTILGSVGNLIEFYHKISIYIQPSIQDGFGITPLEAMAHGRAVIVSDGVGMSELVDDGKDGFVVPMRDIRAIKEKILYFYDNPSEITRMGRNARQKAMNYTWDKIRGEYESIYTSF